MQAKWLQADVAFRFSEHGGDISMVGQEVFSNFNDFILFQDFTPLKPLIGFKADEPQDDPENTVRSVGVLL